VFAQKASGLTCVPRSRAVQTASKRSVCSPLLIRKEVTVHCRLC